MIHSARKYALNASLIVTALFTNSCQKEKDDQAPVILSVTTGEMQHGVALHALANNINRFEIRAIDNAQLKSVRCRLFATDAFHTHTMEEGATNNAFRAPNVGFWQPEKSIDVEGNELNEIMKFNAPADASGQWEIEIAVMDMEGNIPIR
jgi:ABC-type molybdate transport system ATPase subunit